MNFLMTKLIPTSAPHWIFLPHQHEQHHKNDTFHVILCDATPLCDLFCSSISVQSEHFLPIPVGKKK